MEKSKMSVIQEESEDSNEDISAMDSPILSPMREEIQPQSDEESNSMVIEETEISNQEHLGPMSIDSPSDGDHSVSTPSEVEMSTESSNIEEQVVLVSVENPLLPLGGDQSTNMPETSEPSKDKSFVAEQSNLGRNLATFVPERTEPSKEEGLVAEQSNTTSMESSLLLPKIIIGTESSQSSGSDIQSLESSSSTSHKKTQISSPMRDVEDPCSKQAPAPPKKSYENREMEIDQQKLKQAKQKLNLYEYILPSSPGDSDEELKSIESSARARKMSADAKSCARELPENRVISTSNPIEHEVLTSNSSDGEFSPKPASRKDSFPLPKTVSDLEFGSRHLPQAKAASQSPEVIIEADEKFIRQRSLSLPLASGSRPEESKTSKSAPGSLSASPTNPTAIEITFGDILETSSSASLVTYQQISEPSTSSAVPQTGAIADYDPSKSVKRVDRIKSQKQFAFASSTRPSKRRNEDENSKEDSYCPETGENVPRPPSPHKRRRSAPEEALRSEHESESILDPKLLEQSSEKYSSGSSRAPPSKRIYASPRSRIQHGRRKSVPSISPLATTSKESSIAKTFTTHKTNVEYEAHKGNEHDLASASFSGSKRKILKETESYSERKRESKPSPKKIEKRVGKLVKRLRLEEHDSSSTERTEQSSDSSSLEGQEMGGLKSALHKVRSQDDSSSSGSSGMAPYGKQTSLKKNSKESDEDSPPSPPKRMKD